MLFLTSENDILNLFLMFYPNYSKSVSNVTKDLPEIRTISDSSQECCQN